MMTWIVHFYFPLNVHFYFTIYTNGTHFYVSNQSNDGIKQTIREWLKYIEKEHLQKSFYVDYSTFNNIFNHVNIEQIMKTL